MNPHRRRLFRILQNRAENGVKLLLYTLAVFGIIAHAHSAPEIIARSSESFQSPAMDVWENFSRLPVEIVNNVGAWDHARPAPTKPIAIQGNDAALHILNRETEPPAAFGMITAKPELMADEQANKRGEQIGQEQSLHLSDYVLSALFNAACALIGYLWPPNDQPQPMGG